MINHNDGDVHPPPVVYRALLALDLENMEQSDWTPGGDVDVECQAVVDYTGEQGDGETVLQFHGFRIILREDHTWSLIAEDGG